MSDIVNGESCACMKIVNIWERSVPSSQVTVNLGSKKTLENVDNFSFSFTGNINHNSGFSILFSA